MGNKVKINKVNEGISLRNFLGKMPESTKIKIGAAKGTRLIFFGTIKEWRDGGSTYADKIGEKCNRAPGEIYVPLDKRQVVRCYGSCEEPGCEIILVAGTDQFPYAAENEFLEVYGRKLEHKPISPNTDLNNLLVAIYKNAFDEYRQLHAKYKRAKTAKDRVNLAGQMRNVKKFLASDPYGIFQNMSPEKILEKLRDETEY